MTVTSTGIPVEYMFGAIATLIGIIYGGIVHELRGLRRDTHKIRDGAHKRDLLLVKICSRLGIDFEDSD
jgi:hypothetical protein